MEIHLKTNLKVFNHDKSVHMKTYMMTTSNGNTSTSYVFGNNYHKEMCTHFPVFKFFHLNWVFFSKVLKRRILLSSYAPNICTPQLTDDDKTGSSINIILLHLIFCFQTEGLMYIPLRYCEISPIYL